MCAVGLVFCEPGEGVGACHVDTVTFAAGPPQLCHQRLFGEPLPLVSLVCFLNRVHSLPVLVTWRTHQHCTQKGHKRAQSMCIRETEWTGQSPVGCSVRGTHPWWRLGGGAMARPGWQGVCSPAPAGVSARPMRVASPWSSETRVCPPPWRSLRERRKLQVVPRSVDAEITQIPAQTARPHWC